MQNKLVTIVLVTLLFAGIFVVAFKVSPVSAAPVVDGVISPSEYAGGVTVQLVGRTDPNWTVDAYIAWDTEYLYVAVNESVPAGTGTQSWIEFCFDAGPDRAYLDAFVLFCNGEMHHVQCTKPSGSWGWQTYDFLAATNTATEFRVKYTDFGIALGDTIKLVIDRNQGPSPPPPYGFAAFWPQNATVYPDTPDPTTWGDLYLAPSPHVVDGQISPGEYANGMAVTLVGRTDPNFTVNAYIDWDDEYLYVAVKESVPPGTGPQSWIEFAIDPGPSSPCLYAFILLDSGATQYDKYAKPLGKWYVAGSGNFSAVSNVATEFKLKYTDYGITRGDTIKMSIDRNLGPAPPPPYGFAAFWPQNATVYDGTPTQALPTTWGDVHLTLHNVAVTDITLLKTVIGLGYAGNISVTTGDPGDYTESTNTTVYINGTTIITFINITLTSRSSTAMTLTWDTTGASYGMYEVRAVADPVLYEISLTDNNCTCSVLVHVGVPGDVSSSTPGVYDKVVNMKDIAYMVSLFNAKPDSSNWNPNADVNNDGVCNMKDIAIAVVYFNQHE